MLLCVGVINSSVGVIIVVRRIGVIIVVRRIAVIIRRIIVRRVVVILISKVFEDGRAVIGTQTFAIADVFKSALLGRVVGLIDTVSLHKIASLKVFVDERFRVVCRFILRGI